MFLKIKEYFDAGMDGVLSKPLSVPALTQIIEQFWGNNLLNLKKYRVSMRLRVLMNLGSIAIC